MGRVVVRDRLIAGECIDIKMPESGQTMGVKGGTIDTRRLDITSEIAFRTTVK
jgi:hypothetical protein